MKFCSLASGSSGNCLYLKAGDTAILVDAGISCKKICEGLAGIGENPCNIKACFITHDHSDHIKGVAVLMRKYRIPVYATEGTLRAIALADKNGVPRELMYKLVPDREVGLGDISVMPFRISHDAADPVCYTIKHGDSKLGMATDLGEFTDYTLGHLAESNALYVEANHNKNMLMMGPYPYQLKVRIDSSFGHLSNEACGEMVSRLLTPRLKTVVLAHLSLDNNFAELAFETVKNMVDEAALRRGLESPHIVVAERCCATEVFDI